MAENTSIEWADHTFNPWEGCQKVGPGCDHCYAEARNTRFNKGTAVNWGPGAPRRRTSEENWEKPLKWNRQAEAEGRRFRVFCASLADVFDNQVPAVWREDLLQLIADTPHLDWLLLTKRIGNAAEMLDDAMMRVTRGSFEWTHETALQNVWLGATVVSQLEADRDIPKLLAVPARVRFLSIEPMLGPIDLTRIDIDGDREIHPLNGTTDCVDDDGEPCADVPALDWVIAGGESGPHARPMHPDWARNLRDQCAAASVPFLFKQWGEWAPATRRIRCPNLCTDGVDGEPDGFGGAYAGTCMTCEGSGRAPWERLGKKAAGRLLDGVEHNGFPQGT